MAVYFIYSKSPTEHLKDVLHVFRENRLFLKLKKMCIPHSLLFLGFIISAQGISVDPNKVQAKEIGKL